MGKYLSSTPQSSIILAAFIVAFFANALRGFLCLVGEVIWRKGRPVQYNSLWVLPYGLVLMLGVHPPRSFNQELLKICLMLWLFTLLCAIIQAKVSSGMTWRLWGEEHIERFFDGVAWVRKWILKAGNWKKLSEIPFSVRMIALLLILLMFVAAAMWEPTAAIPALVLLYLASVILGLYRSVHSCGKLLGLWFFGAFIHALAGAVAILDLLPNNVVHPVIAYGSFILFFAALWILTALVADYDVAKMASGIVNTTTTILILAVNVIFSYCKATVYVPLPEWDFGYLIYGCNLILLPIVVAGYMAALFVEGQEYYSKRRHFNNKDI